MISEIFLNRKIAFTKIFSKTFIHFLRVTIGIVFFLSGLGKLFDLSTFIQTVEKYNILAPKLIIPFSGTVVLLELLFGIAFIIGILIRASSLGLSTLLLSFLIAIDYKIDEEIPLGCGCSGIFSDNVITPFLFFKDLLLLVVVGIIFSSYTSSRADNAIALAKYSLLQSIFMYSICIVLALCVIIL